PPSQSIGASASTGTKRQPTEIADRDLVSDKKPPEGPLAESPAERARGAENEEQDDEPDLDDPEAHRRKPPREFLVARRETLVAEFEERLRILEEEDHEHVDEGLQQRGDEDRAAFQPGEELD